jgi:hypothetical protein
MIKSTQRILLMMLVMFATLHAKAQTISSTVLPQYAKGNDGGGANAERCPMYFWAKLTGLTANTTYRYGVRAIREAQDKSTSRGAGNQIFVRNGGANGYSSTYTIKTSGGYDSLTADNQGNYEGWFGLELTGNVRFKDGNYIKPRIILNNGVVADSEFFFLTTADSFKCLNFSTTSGVGGSAIYSHSKATDKNFALLYDNVNGTGRPLSIAIIEQDGYNYRTLTTTSTFYKDYVDSISGAWGTIIPNDNPNGVRRIENRKLSDGTLVYANTDADGVWPTGSVNTVNPVNGNAEIMIDGTTDAPLIPSGGSNPEVSFNVTSQSQSENVSTFTVTVNIANPNANATSVEVAAIGGTATSGTDYTYSTQTVTFPANSSAAQTFNVSITNDNTVESDETIILELQNATNSATISSTQGKDTLTIQNDDNSANPVVSLADMTQTVSEGAGTVTVTVSIASPNANATSVDVSVASGSATSGTDYTYSTQTVTFPANSSASQTVSITLSDDAAVESSENIILTLANATNSATYGNMYDTITITDNDGAPLRPRVRFELDSSSTNEGTSATIKVMMDTTTSSAVTADVEITGGSAVSGTNYTYTKQTITFAAGSKTPQTVSVQTNSDNKVMVNNDIIFSLTNLSANADLGTPTAYKLRVVENGINGVDKIALKYQLQFFPNPNSEILNITSNSAMQAITLLDITGKKVAHYTVNGLNYSLNTNTLAAGVYYIQVMIDNQMATQKIVVN